MLKEGMFIQERYEIVSKIGTGGMADVYKAKDHKLNRFVAVKVLKPEFREDKAFISKFRVEAQSAAGLAHPNIVNVYDAGDDNGVCFIVMELVEGIPMEKIKLLLLGILFLVCMGTVLRILPYGISFLAVVIVGMIAFRDLFAQVDYFLLGTFAGFFLFVGNVQRIPSVSRWIGSVMEGKEFWLSIGCSQIISNVPATMLLSGFTTEYKELLWGVNIGGLGTLIASLASLISYKFYASVKGAQRGRYMLVFTVYNVVFLLLLCLFAAISGTGR